jgi:uncharacterized membrane protein YbaN (DUF454 family)
MLENLVTLLVGLLCVVGMVILGIVIVGMALCALAVVAYILAGLCYAVLWVRDRFRWLVWFSWQ